MTDAAFWWVNTVTVKTYLGTKNGVTQFADPVDVGCWVEEGSHLVLNAQGQEVVSSTEVRGPLAQAALFAANSLIRTPGQNRDARVITVDRFDSGTLDLGVDHFAAHLV